MKGKVKFINRKYSTQNYRAFWSHVLLAQGPKLQWGEPHSGVRKSYWWQGSRGDQYCTTKCPLLPAWLVGDMAKNPSWTCICPPSPYAAPPCSGVAGQPSAMWLRFHQRRSSLLLSCAFMAMGAETGNCGPPHPFKAIQDLNNSN